MSSLSPFQGEITSESISSGQISVSSGSIGANVSGGIIVSGSVQVSGTVFTSVSGNIIQLPTGVSLESGFGLSGAWGVANVVYDYSGAKWNPVTTAISGANVPAVWIASGTVLASTTSGEVHVMSGTIGVSGMFITWAAGPLIQSGMGNICGIMGPMGLVAWDLSGKTWNAITVSNSGNNILNTAAAVTANVASGLWLASGIVPASGVIPNISGQAVSVSGNIISLAGGTSLESGFGLSGAWGVANTAWDAGGLKWNALSVITSGSATLGVGIRPSTIVRIGLSGIGFQGSASGAAINSGIPSLSGGVLLLSGDVNTCVIRNNPGNNVMYIGSTTERPCSGFGFYLAGGDGLTLNVNNFNLIAAFACTSGQYLSYIGTQTYT